MNKNTYNLITNLSTLFGNSRLKPTLYNSLIATSQLIALHRLKRFTGHNEHSFHPYSSEVNGKKIIVHSVHGSYLPAIYKEGAITKALRLNGHDAKMLFCNQRIKSCCGLFTLDHPSSPHDCARCVQFSTHFCESLGIPRLVYSGFVSEVDPTEQIMKIGESDPIKNPHFYKGVNIGLHAQTGTDRYFKGDQTSDHHSHFVSKLIDASVVVDVAEQILQKEKPDLILTSHSCYSEWGPFSEYFKNHKIPVFTWFTGYDPNTLVFDLPTVGKDFEKWSERWSTYFTEYTAKPELQNFLKKRKSGMGESVLYGFTQTLKHLEYCQYKKVFALFPNMPWDADPSCSTLFFPTIMDWISTTIRFFSKHPEYLLIIKTHPAESLYHSRDSIFEKIQSNLNLPRNVILLPPDTDISAYDLFPSLTAGIVSNTTTGLELLLEGIPIITVGEAHYRNKGFTYDPKTLKEYLSVLGSDSFVIEDQNRLWLYAYYYFIKSFIPFNLYKRKNMLDIGFTFSNLETLKSNPEINHIVECLTTEKLFQDW